MSKNSVTSMKNSSGSGGVNSGGEEWWSGEEWVRGGRWIAEKAGRVLCGGERARMARGVAQEKWCEATLRPSR